MWRAGLRVSFSRPHLRLQWLRFGSFFFMRAILVCGQFSLCAIANRRVPRLSSLVSEKQRENDLHARLHEAELSLAGLPPCRADALAPAVQPAPAIQNSPPADVPPKDTLTLPRRPEDLAGCWQPDQGDFDAHTDNAGEGLWSNGEPASVSMRRGKAAFSWSIAQE